MNGISLPGTFPCHFFHSDKLVGFRFDKDLSVFDRFFERDSDNFDVRLFYQIKQFNFGVRF